MISYTAQYLAALRAAAVEEGTALVRDNHAHLFAGPELIERMRPGARDPILQYLQLRHRLLEDLLRAALSAPVQVILLGAGFDTKYQRMALPPGTRWIELDRPGMVEHKRGILETEGLSVPEAIPRTIESVDDILHVLACTDPAQPALILAEGFFPYGTEEFLCETLEAIVGYYDDRPTLGFDLLSPSAATEARTEDLHEKTPERLLCSVAPERTRAVLEALGYAPSIWGFARMHRRYLGGESQVAPPAYVTIGRAPALIWDDGEDPPRGVAFP